MPKRPASSARSFAEAGIAVAGSNGSASRRSDAVPGMNWATPRAPAGLTAPGWNALSRQMSLVKKSIGSPSVLAEVSTIPHSVAKASSLAGSAAPAAVRGAGQMMSAARNSAPAARQAMRRVRQSGRACGASLAAGFQPGPTRLDRGGSTTGFHPFGAG